MQHESSGPAGASTGVTTSAGAAGGSIGGSAAALLDSPDTPIRRLVVLVVAIALSIIAFRATVPFVASERGVTGPLVSDAASPVAAAVAILLAFAVTTAVSAIVGKLVNAVVGVFVLGTGIGYLAMRSGSAVDFAFGGSSVVAAGVELLVWAALAAGASHIIFRVGGPLPDFPPTYEDEFDSPVGKHAVRSWASALLGVAVAWFVLASTTKGQAIGAATVGGFAVGCAGRIISPRTTPVYLAVSFVLAMALVDLGLGFTGSGDLSAQFVEGKFPRLFMMMPFDIVAGSLCGTALGFGFMRSFVPSPAESH